MQTRQGPPPELLAKLAEARRVPDEAEIERLLDEHFLAASPEIARRLHGELVALLADPAARAGHEAAIAANVRDYYGQHWAEMAGRDVPTGPRALAIWLALQTRGYPAPRPYCPPALVGGWDRLDEDVHWELRADGSAEITDARFDGARRWCSHRMGDLGPRGDELWLVGPRETHYLQIAHVDGDVLEVVPVGSRHDRLRLTRTRHVKRARTLREMQFAMSLTSCFRCGHRDGAEADDLYGGGDRWALTRVCPGCGQRRALTWSTYGNPFEAPQPRCELGGPMPSEIIQPDDFLAEHARLRPLTLRDPRELGPAEWRATLRATQRALTTVLELLKFPEPAAWLVEERDRLAKLEERYRDDGSRIDALVAAARADRKGTT